MLGAQAPDLHDALQCAKDDNLTHLVLDGKLFSADRLGEQTTSVKGEQIDAWYSGKHREQGGNVQALMVPPTGSRSGAPRSNPAPLTTSPQGLVEAHSPDLPKTNDHETGCQPSPSVL